jgi:LysM repeat protein
MPVAEIYIVKPGDTFSAIAKAKRLTIKELRDANMQIKNINKIMVGEAIKIPAKVVPAGTATIPAGSVAAPILAPATGHAQTYDGSTPAPGTTTADKTAYNHPPLTNLTPPRDANTYAQVINQFAVGHNSRYIKTPGKTYCNIFVWDVTRAMGCEIPHWVNASGDTAVPKAPGANEININSGIDWMLSKGIPHHGWQMADATTAQAQANQGKPAVAMWKNTISGGHGHTAMIRPGTMHSIKGPATAQAGGVNFNQGHMTDGFGAHVPHYYIHD